MNILLINWKNGENNPFGYFNENLKEKFQEFGCNSFIVDYDSNFLTRISEITIDKYIHLAITHQGIGSDLQLNSDKKCFWELVQIPLLLLHSEHPSFMSNNHIIDNKYVVHSYCI